MQPVFLESTRTLTPDEFEAWDQLRQSLGDRHRTELLNGRVVMGPPAGYPHGVIEGSWVGLLYAFVQRGKSGQVFGSTFFQAQRNSGMENGAYVKRKDL